MKFEATFRIPIKATDAAAAERTMDRIWQLIEEHPECSIENMTTDPFIMELDGKSKRARASLEALWEEQDRIQREEPPLPGGGWRCAHWADREEGAVSA